MSYIDGFVIAVPTENKQKFIDHAHTANSIFIELGALRVIECWRDDVPEGELTDFGKAVQAKENESVVFSWVEWPDKATRNTAMEQMEGLMKTDDRFSAEKNPMPFDGKRLIYGGFEQIVDIAPPMQTRAQTGVQPYLFFRGRCEEAIGYYKDVLGADVLMMMRWSENPDKSEDTPSGLDNKIMHACLHINGSNIMMSDGMRDGPLDFECMSLSLSLASKDDAERIFNALAKGGETQMPLGETFFASCFGSVMDKFGVAWMVIVENSEAS